MLNIPHYGKYNGEKRIALLDNSTVSFMQQLDHRGYRPGSLLQGYDVIFLPGWVAEEIQDSGIRVRYIEKLARQHKGLFPGDTIPGNRPFLLQGKRRIIRNLPCSLNMIFYMEAAGG